MVGPWKSAGCASRVSGGTSVGVAPVARAAASAPTARPCLISWSVLPSPTIPPVAITDGGMSSLGKKRAATGSQIGLSPAIFRRLVGAVQPVAVISRSAGILVPSSHSTAFSRPRPIARRSVTPVRASITKAISTPADRRRSTASSPLALAVRITARVPGRTACNSKSLIAAVESMTPGRSLPAKT